MCVCVWREGERCVGVNGAAERVLYEYVLSLPSSNKREGMRHPPPPSGPPPPLDSSQEKESKKKKGGKEDDET